MEREERVRTKRSKESGISSGDIERTSTCQDVEVWFYVISLRKRK